MVSARAATATVGVLASLAVSVLVWHVYGVALFFLAVPFVPVLFRRRGGHSEPSVHECPECGFQAHDPEFVYCPRDGARLEAR